MARQALNKVYFLFASALCVTSLCLPVTAQAVFEYLDYEIRKTVTIPSDNSVDITFDVRFRSYAIESQQKIYQRYRFAISDDSMSGRGNTLPSQPNGDYGEYIQNTIQVSGTPQGMSLKLGRWSTQAAPDKDITTLTFTLTLKTSGLKKLFDNKENLEFYLVGQDAQTPEYHWLSIPVTISLAKPGQARISKLEDMILPANNASATIYPCIYSSSGKASVLFDARNTVKGEEYYLTDSTQAYSIPYKVDIRFLNKNGKEQDSFNIAKEGEKETEPYKISGKEGNCLDTKFGYNSTITIEADQSFVNNAPSGVFSDVMTVVITPK